MTPNDYVKYYLAEYPSLYSNRFSVISDLFERDVDWIDGELNPEGLSSNKLNLDQSYNRNLKILNEVADDRKSATVCPDQYIDAKARLNQYLYTMENIDVFSSTYAFGSEDRELYYRYSWPRWVERYSLERLHIKSSMSSIPDNITDEWKNAIEGFIYENVLYIMNVRFGTGKDSLEKIECEDEKVFAMFLTNELYPKVLTKKRKDSRKASIDMIQELLDEIDAEDGII